MKRTSVFLNYCIILLGLVFVLFIIFNTVGTWIMTVQLKNTKKAELLKEANQIKSTYIDEYYARSLDIDDLADRLEIAGDMTGDRIWIMSPNGTVIVDSAKRVQKSVLPEEYFKLMQDGTVENFTVPNLITEPVLCVSVPIMYSFSVRGYLSVMMPMSSLAESAAYYSNFINICYFLFVPALLLAFIGMYLISVRPVIRLSAQTRKYAEKNFKGDFVLKYPAELAELGGTIKFMGEKLSGNDTTQRAFLSNVSHDFRSPLTSIHGYLEAMKDGTIPVEQQEKYFDILLYETERLTKLTSNILQLNNIDDNGLMLNKSVFDINKMIRQIALTFEGTFKKKKLVLNLVFSQKETFVEADMDRIQQVIYNLVDNAVKFTPSDSSIKITTEEKGNKVYVSIKDHGMGIPKESINKIWDRFYKTDQSRGRDKKGSGLGLSIVKEIINAHGQTISCTSTEGVGTEFTFTLKVAK